MTLGKGDTARVWPLVVSASPQVLMISEHRDNIPFRTSSGLENGALTVPQRWSQHGSSSHSSSALLVLLG